MPSCSVSNASARSGLLRALGGEPRLLRSGIDHPLPHFPSLARAHHPSHGSSVEIRVIRTGTRMTPPTGTACRHDREGDDTGKESRGPPPAYGSHALTRDCYLNLGRDDRVVMAAGAVPNLSLKAYSSQITSSDR